MISLFIQAKAQQTETMSLGRVKMVFTLDKPDPGLFSLFNDKPIILPSGLDSG
jgi:hypothetical protein